MNFESLGNIGDFIGGIGVIVTLAYLALQIRQNTIATKADSYQSVVALASEWSRDLSLNAEICDIMDRGARDYSSLDRVEELRFNLAMSSYFRNMENLHHKFISGNVDATVWQGWSNRTLAFIRAPGTSAWWDLNASAFSPAFRDFIALSEEPTEIPGAFGFDPRS
ncbi:MAG: hypothetical protein KDI33_16370 [Halioglobus sp.]|nr:hypothetical protein [Halioglobus sp.]